MAERICMDCKNVFEVDRDNPSCPYCNQNKDSFDEVLSYIRLNPGVNAFQISDALDIDITTINNIIKDLNHQGRLK